jgi:outer membrane protein assembly factor BamE (lipoprotein component of BamABCDE complex)
MKSTFLFVAILLAFAACTSQKNEHPDRVWTEPELRALQGKTRDEVRDILGDPRGLGTFDSKDRWHYSDIRISGEHSGSSEHVSVLVYFSKFGEHRATLVEVRHRIEE